LFVNSGCHFCTDSMPFYKTLVSARNQRKTRVALIAVSRESQADLDTYLRIHEVVVDRTISIQRLSNVKLRVTPTLVLVDGSGKVQRVWVGALKRDQEFEVLHAVGG
jgi:hypothetical protein